jgi:hypothetical protein
MPSRRWHVRLITLGRVSFGLTRLKKLSAPVRPSGVTLSGWVALGRAENGSPLVEMEGRPVETLDLTTRQSGKISDPGRKVSREIAKASAGRVGGEDQAERESDCRTGGDDRAHLGDRDKGHGQDGEVEGK